MLQPKRTKYRKVQKGRNSGRGHELSNGMFGIKSVHEDGMFLTSRQIECSYCCNSFHEKRGTIMDQNISRQTNY
jgi:large subunit ribosomal protein L16